MLSRIKSNIVWSYSGQLATLTVGIIGSIILARNLGPEGRGIYALILATAELLTEVLGKNSFIVSFTYFISKKLINIDELINQIIRYVLLVGLLAIILSRLFDNINFGGFVELGTSEIWICIEYSLAITCWGLTSGILVGMDKIRFNNIVVLVNNTFNVLILVIFLILLKLRFNGGIYQIFASSIFLVFVSMLILSKYAKLKPSLDLQASKQISFYAGKLYPGYIGNFMLMQLDLIVLGIFSNAYSLGIYSVAKSIILPIALLEPPVTQALVPFIASKDQYQAVAVLNRGFHILFWLLALVIVLMGFVLPIMVPIVYGQDFKDVSMTLLFLLPGQFAVASRTIYSYFYYQIGKPELLTYISLLTGLICLPVYILFSIWWDYIGISIAVSLGLLLKSMVVISFYSFLTKQNIFRIFLFDKHEMYQFWNLFLSIRRVRNITMKGRMSWKDS